MGSWTHTNNFSISCASANRKYLSCIVNQCLASSSLVCLSEKVPAEGYFVPLTKSFYFLHQCSEQTVQRRTLLSSLKGNEGRGGETWPLRGQLVPPSADISSCRWNTTTRITFQSFLSPLDHNTKQLPTPQRNI